MLLNKSDFTGIYEIYSGKDAFSKIDAYIEEFEPELIVWLLGQTLGQEIIDELEDSPIPARTQALIDNGLKKGLLGMIYFELMADEPFKISGLGLKLNVSEASQAANVRSYIQIRYNKGIKAFKDVQEYINRNMANYEGYIYQRDVIVGGMF